MRRHAEFTLVEIMIVVSIISLLVVMVVPSFQRARQRAQNAKLINGLRVATDTFQMYATEHGSSSADVNRGTVPAGMDLYFGPTFDFTKTTPIGATRTGITNSLDSPPAFQLSVRAQTQLACRKSMERIDDGDLNTGGFQNTAADRFTSIIE